MCASLNATHPTRLCPSSVFQTKRPTKQTVRFLPVASTSDGSSFVQGGHIPSPPRRPRAVALVSPSPPSSAFSPSFTSSSVPLLIERVGVTPGSFATKKSKTLPKRVGKGYPGNKAADQASKMRDRQKRFDTLFVIVIFLSFCISAHSTVDIYVRR